MIFPVSFMIMRYRKSTESFAGMRSGKDIFQSNICPIGKSSGSIDESVISALERLYTMNEESLVEPTNRLPSNMVSRPPASIVMSDAVPCNCTVNVSSGLIMLMPKLALRVPDAVGI